MSESETSFTFVFELDDTPLDSLYSPNDSPFDVNLFFDIDAFTNGGADEPHIPIAPAEECMQSLFIESQPAQPPMQERYSHDATDMPELFYFTQLPFLDSTSGHHTPGPQADYSGATQATVDLLRVNTSLQSYLYTGPLSNESITSPQFPLEAHVHTVTPGPHLEVPHQFAPQGRPRSQSDGANTRPSHPANAPVNRERGSSFSQALIPQLPDRSGPVTSVSPSTRGRSISRSGSRSRNSSPYFQPTRGRNRSGSDVSNMSSISSFQSIPPLSTPVSPANSNAELSESSYRPVVASDAVRAANMGNRKRDAPFQCPFCPSTFTAKQRLDTHKNSHFGIRNYVCTTCNQRFVQASDLKRHERSRKHRDAVDAVSPPSF